MSYPGYGSGTLNLLQSSLSGYHSNVSLVIFPNIFIWTAACWSSRSHWQRQKTITIINFKVPLAKGSGFDNSGCYLFIQPSYDYIIIILVLRCGETGWEYGGHGSVWGGGRDNRFPSSTMLALHKVQLEGVQGVDMGLHAQKMLAVIRV